LIIVNCIIICRCEVCASRQSVFAAAADAVGQTIGFGLALVSIAAVRELLGTGMLAGFPVMPDAWPAWVIMVLPPGAFLTFGLLLGLVNWVDAVRSSGQQRRGQ
jgi:electron transport complex protein RnfE